MTLSYRIMTVLFQFTCVPSFRWHAVRSFSSYYVRSFSSHDCTRRALGRRFGRTFLKLRRRSTHVSQFRPLSFRVELRWFISRRAVSSARHHVSMQLFDARKQLLELFWPPVVLHASFAALDVVSVRKSHSNRACWRPVHGFQHEQRNRFSKSVCQPYFSLARWWHGKALSYTKDDDVSST